MATCNWRQADARRDRSGYRRGLRGAPVKRFCAAGLRCPAPGSARRLLLGWGRSRSGSARRYALAEVGRCRALRSAVAELGTGAHARGVVHGFVRKLISSVPALASASQAHGRQCRGRQRGHRRDARRHHAGATADARRAPGYWRRMRRRRPPPPIADEPQSRGSGARSASSGFATEQSTLVLRTSIRRCRRASAVARAQHQRRRWGEGVGRPVRHSPSIAPVRPRPEPARPACPLDQGAVTMIMGALAWKVAPLIAPSARGGVLADRVGERRPRRFTMSS